MPYRSPKQKLNREKAAHATEVGDYYDARQVPYTPPLRHNMMFVCKEASREGSLFATWQCHNEKYNLISGFVHHLPSNASESCNSRPAENHKCSLMPIG